MRVIPITDSEPVSIVKPEPPVAAGQGSGDQARTTTPLGTQWSARSDVEARDVAWRHVTDRFPGTDEAGEGCRRGLGHRQVARRRLGCWPRQDDQRAQSRLAGTPLAALDQGLGQ